jgi:hypothetical protein
MYEDSVQENRTLGKCQCCGTPNLESELLISLREIKQMLEWFVKNAPDGRWIDLMDILEFDARMKRAQSLITRAEDARHE